MVCPACVIGFIGSQAPVIAASVGTGLAALMAVPRLQKSSPLHGTQPAANPRQLGMHINDKAATKACCKPPKAKPLEAGKP